MKYIHKIKNIFIGWGRALGFLSTPTAVGKLSDKRLKICGGCEFAKQHKILEVINGNLEYIHSTYCQKCHCPCLEKTLVVDESCPLGKW